MILLIYHQAHPYNQIEGDVNCPDSICAAWVADRYIRGRSWNEQHTVLEWRDPSVSPDVSEYKTIFILGFCFQRNVIDSWVNIGKQVIIIDHHETTQRTLAGISRFSEKFEFHFNPLDSGATLAWKYFQPPFAGEMPAFLEYVRDRALQKHKLPRSKEIHETWDEMRLDLKRTAERHKLSATDLIFASFDKLASMSRDQIQIYYGDR